ncbi:hypothetical protein CONPUDRAFT_139381 [Coniophora puteana RWD-64-598 SS2]|uniref:C2H2-type domain-containing protein n=1 Tax=Coniophora puteana (strain RWD-64-598) TaxID=741705 RepID=A0A5M3MCQ4_CONPW|nr:uncharacterized protein CONPUDRAFT_139381 [Coniophora puteana RWD-64-598 SS2]EIW76630.1 hypothetical protein CONPUDRAFT_139381 [Coniophora puteana RWD-64-598 SS2]
MPPTRKSKARFECMHTACLLKAQPTYFSGSRDARVHIEGKHLALKRYRCLACAYATPDPSSIRRHCRSRHQYTRGQPVMWFEDIAGTQKDDWKHFYVKLAPLQNFGSPRNTFVFDMQDLFSGMPAQHGGRESTAPGNLAIAPTFHVQQPNAPLADTLVSSESSTSVNNLPWPAPSWL